MIKINNTMRRYSLIIIISAFLIWLASGFITPTVVFTSIRPVNLAHNNGTSIGELFTGEEFVYQIGFWIFDDVATGSLTLKKEENGEYTSTLTAQTTGVAGFLLRYRKDTYVARIEEINGGKRFRTKTFEKSIEMGGKARKGLTVLDYGNGLLTWKSWGGGKEEKSGENKIPDGSFYDDPLTAFYNFRFGVYGEIKEGSEYRVPTFPKNGVTDIYLRLAKREEMDTRLGEKSRITGYLADVKIDKELFGQQSGEIEILFSDGLIPFEAVAKDIIFFGDVRGKLKEVGVEMGFKKTGERPVEEQGK